MSAEWQPQAASALASRKRTSNAFLLEWRPAYSNQGPVFGGEDVWVPNGRALAFANDDGNGQHQQPRPAFSSSLRPFANPPFFNEYCWNPGNGLAATARSGFGAAAWDTEDTAGAGAGADGDDEGSAGELDASRLALAAPRSTKRRKGGADDDRKNIQQQGSSSWAVAVRIEGKQVSAGSYTSLRFARIGRDASLKVIARKTRKSAAAVAELAKEAGRIAVDRHINFSWTPPVNDAVYAHGSEWKYHLALTDLMRKYITAYEIPGLIGKHHAARIREIFAGFYPSVAISESNWKKARSLSNDGRLVVAAEDGSAPGERVSGTFERLNSGLFNGMNNSGNEMAFESTFRNKEACERYCASYFSCVAVRNELVRLMDRYDIDVVTALKRLDNVMSPAKAKKEVLSVLAQISKDFSKVHEMTARQLLLLIANAVFDESKFIGRVTRRDLDNGRRILGENGLHSKVIAGWLELAVQKGLGAIHERLDLEDDGASYLDISVPTPERYLKEDCQGVSYRNRGDPLDYKRIVEVENDRLCGSTGYTFTREMRVFRDIANDAYRAPATPNVDRWFSGLPNVSLHQLVLCTAHAYGGSIHHDAHFNRGGILFGALEEGETWASKFHIKITKARLDSLVAEYGDVFGKTCDSDHLFGRNAKELNGLPYCLLLPHVQNIARMWSRRKLNDWLFLFFVGAYAGGNDTPDAMTVRDIFAN